MPGPDNPASCCTIILLAGESAIYILMYKVYNFYKAFRETSARTHEVHVDLARIDSIGPGSSPISGTYLRAILSAPSWISGSPKIYPE